MPTPNVCQVLICKTEFEETKHTNKLFTGTRTIKKENKQDGEREKIFDLMTGYQMDGSSIA